MNRFDDMNDDINDEANTVVESLPGKTIREAYELLRKTKWGILHLPIDVPGTDVLRMRIRKSDIHDPVYVEDDYVIQDEDIIEFVKDGDFRSN